LKIWGILFKMGQKIEIQKRILITKKEFDEILNKYKNISNHFSMGYNGKAMNKEGIIKEIENLTETGKKILLLEYNFKHSDFYKEYLKTKR